MDAGGSLRSAGTITENSIEPGRGRGLFLP